MSRQYWNSIMSAVAFLQLFETPHLRSGFVALVKTVALMVSRQSLTRPQKGSQYVRGLEILVAKVSVLRALSNFRPADYWETLSRPKKNGVVLHRAGRGKGQESPPWAGTVGSPPKATLSFLLRRHFRLSAAAVLPRPVSEQLYVTVKLEELAEMCQVISFVVIALVH